MTPTLIRNNYTFLILSGATLLLGLINYILIHPSVTFFGRIRIDHEVYFSTKNIVSIIAKNYFSDIAWCISLICALVFLKKNNLLSKTGKVTILSIPFTTEILQHLKIVKGTFDWVDILIYSLIIGFYFLFID